LFRDERFETLRAMRGRPLNPYLADEFTAARRLRGEGESMKRIAATLGVSLSTVSLWVRDIELTDEQKHANRLRGAKVRSDRWSEKHRAVRLAAQADGRARARQGDSLHLAGCMLYWCEGNKSRNSLRLVNSDLQLLVFFQRFLRECFELEDERFTVGLNVYLGDGPTLRDVEDHWLEALELPRSCLRKPILNHKPTSSSGRKTDKLPYGCCGLGVRRSTPTLQHIYGAIQEYGGFEEPRWLDGLY
jgi:hypothetical protein